MEEVVVDYFWIIVMFFSALWTLILLHPLHFHFQQKKIFRVNYSFKYYVHNDISALGKIVSFFFLCADYARWIVSVYTAYLVCAKNDDACKMEVSGEH